MAEEKEEKKAVDKLVQEMRKIVVPKNDFVHMNTLISRLSPEWLYAIRKTIAKAVHVSGGAVTNKYQVHGLRFKVISYSWMDLGTMLSFALLIVSLLRSIAPLENAVAALVLILALVYGFNGDVVKFFVFNHLFPVLVLSLFVLT
jgi:hypothetical protein